MPALENQTPFAAAIVPGLTKDGVDTVTVVVKGTFSLRGQSADPRVADEQAPVRYTDVFQGEPGRSSLRYEADTSPAKRRTDIALWGHAYAMGTAPSVDVRLAVGRYEKTVRVFGDRVWHDLLGAWRVSEPVAFERMPLVYERAFGGVDATDADPARHVREARNPIGTGLCAAETAARLEGLRLPNLEDPAALIERPLDRPAPAGFGFIGRDWAPRVGFAGTYDEAWRKDRCPLLPADFDERYFNAGAAGLITPQPLAGGEVVALTGAMASGELRFTLPRRRIEAALRVRSEQTEHAATIDTLLIEPDERRATVTWKVTVPCPRSMLYLRGVKVTERERG